MEIKKEFEKFINNLKVKNAAEISVSYKGVTKKLNQTFHDDDSETSNSLQIGSYGRKTAVNGISDLDMSFELPDDMYDRFDKYEGNGQSALLQEVSKALKEKYKDSDIKADGQVVVFNHTSYKIEVLPVFSEDDGSFTYADTNDGGSWKTTKPREEIQAISDINNESDGVLKKLCRMTRAWKNHVGTPMSGLLIDTLCHDFLVENKKFYGIDFDEYGELSRSFFEYLTKSDPERVFWYAPGSNQKVEKTSNFVPKAKKALKNCERAIEKAGKEVARKYWKRVYGRSFPVKEKSDSRDMSEVNFRDTEQFIEDLFPVKISEELTIDCTVTQDGFRPTLLSKILFLKNKFNLEFFISETSVREPFDVYWKVRNIGEVAERRDCIRGQIEKDKGHKKKKETSNFDGDHFVECFIVKNNYVVARDVIDVNISDLEH